MDWYCTFGSFTTRNRTHARDGWFNLQEFPGYATWSWWSPRYRRISQVHEESSLVDYPGTWSVLNIWVRIFIKKIYGFLEGGGGGEQGWEEMEIQKHKIGEGERIYIFRGLVLNG